MKQVFKHLVMVCFCMVAVATGADMLGFVPETGLLAEIVDFIVPAGMMLGSAAAVAGPGEGAPGAAELGDGSAEYIDEDLNKTIVKVRPSDTPLDTLTREINSVEHVSSYEAGGWEIGTREVQDKVTTATSAAATTTELAVDNIDIWLPGDTIIVKGQTAADGNPLGLLVLSKGTGSSLNVRAINGDGDGKVPVIAQNAELFRLSTAHAEKTAQATPYNIAPTNRKNYCQIHMAQVEETVIHGLQKKKVNMDFSVYKEQTIWEMKRGMELTNLFGVKGISYNANGEMIYLSNGLWNQCTQSSTYSKTNGFNNAAYIALTREIFDGNNGSERRFLFAGSGLLQAMSNVEAYSKQVEAKNVEVVHGVRVLRIETSFGELLIKPMGSLFEGLHADDGLVLDLNYVKKYVREPLTATELDLDKTGQRRVKAMRLLEDYCLFLENLPVHRKIVASAS